MVGKTFAVPRKLAHWGANCAVWCGLVLLGNAGFCEDQPATEAPAEQPAASVSFAKSAAADPADDAAERKALEDAVQEFADAFNKHDIQAVMARYTNNAELTDQGGKITRGTKALHETFTRVFNDQPHIKISLEVQSLRFLSPGVALEEGVSVMTSGDEHASAAHHDRYTVTHVKQDGKWFIAAARDWAPTPAGATEQLKQLEWLVGDWVDENSDTLVHTSYHWSEDHHFLFSKYQVQRAGQPAVEGLQRIGWDPQRQQLHSWTFDSAGKFSEGYWSRAGDTWVMKLTGVMADGRIRSATNILTKLGPDHATFQSRDRVIGNEVLPDLGAVPIVRKAPQPSLPKATEQTAKQPNKKSESK